MMKEEKTLQQQQQQKEDEEYEEENESISRINDLYAQARSVRIREGHFAAVPLYQKLQRENPKDCSAATYLASSWETPLQHDQTCLYHNNENNNENDIEEEREEKLKELRNYLLNEFEYTNARVQQLFQIPSSQTFSSGPLYIQTLEAGSINTPPTPRSALECLVSLFLIGIVVQQTLVQRYLGTKFFELLLQFGLVFIENNVVIPLVHLFPLEIPKPTTTTFQHHDNNKIVDNLLICTDLHPRILSTISVGTQGHDAVMYIGPDSLSLVQQQCHFSSSFQQQNHATNICALDLCTGSGVQALALASMWSFSSHSNQHQRLECTCVDINPRALIFCKFNAQLNRMQQRSVDMKYIQHDLFSLTKQEDNNSPSLPWNQRQNYYDVILANPPFVPVPPQINNNNYFGQFSSAGPDTNHVLNNILQLISRIWKQSLFVGIVSEFFFTHPENNEQQDTESTILIRQFQQAWQQQNEHKNKTMGLLVTNEYPISVMEYSKRRAAREEQDLWIRHLQQDLNIAQISPGLLFLMPSSSAKQQQNHLEIKHCRLPKTQKGSIWTPANHYAIDFVRQEIQHLSTTTTARTRP